MQLIDARASRATGTHIIDDITHYLFDDSLEDIFDMYGIETEDLIGRVRVGLMQSIMDHNKNE
jgi:hypothetical protein